MSDSKGFDSKRFAKYASLKHPEKTLPTGTYFWHTPRTLTVEEQHRKSEFHYILLPRVGAPPRVPENLTDLYTLLTSPEVSKSEAEALLREMREDAEVLKTQLEEETVERHDFKGNFWMGFKVAPSYQYLHLHVMTDDLDADGLKYPRHFFSFHPEHGEFVHLDEVLSWFEIVEERYKDNIKDLGKKRRKLSRRPSSDDEGEVKERRAYDCYHKDGGIECLFEAKDLPTMKRHLNEHFLKRREEGRKRKDARQKFERQQAKWKARLAEEKRQEEKRKEDNAHDGTESELQLAPTTGQDESARKD